MLQALLLAAEHLPASLTMMHQAGRNLGMKKTCHFKLGPKAHLLGLSPEEVIDFGPEYWGC